MNNVLSNILMQCGLIVPLEETETDVLAKACSEYIGNESFSFGDFEELADCYVTNRDCKELNDFVTEYISNNGLGNYIFPKRIKYALVFYCIYLAITECDDDKKIALRSLSLQNVMLQVHGKWEKLNFQNILYKLYFKYEQYAEGEVSGEKKYPREFVQSMFIDNFRQGETISEDMSDKIQSLALMAWDAEMSQFIKGLKETNDFLKIQLILEHYFNNKPQILQNEDLVELMQRIFPRGGNGQRQKIEKILKTLAETDVCLVDKIRSESSLLLYEIDNARNNEYGNYLKGFALSPKEFFVYLYHELLLEDLLKE